MTDPTTEYDALVAAEFEHEDYLDSFEEPTDEDLAAMEACIPELIATNPALADYFE